MVEEVFRLTGACYRCSTHWDGSQCTLAKRLPKLVPAIEGPLAPCPIRFAGNGGCRHFSQEGEAICRYCVGYAYADSVVLPHDVDPSTHIEGGDRSWL